MDPRVEEIRDFVRSHIPLIMASGAYKSLEHGARRRSAWSALGADMDEEDAADEILEILLQIIDEAGVRALPLGGGVDLVEAVRAGAATLLLERLPAATHHFSVLGLILELDERDRDAAYDNWLADGGDEDDFSDLSPYNSETSLTRVMAESPPPQPSLEEAFVAAKKLYPQPPGDAIDLSQLTEAWTRFLEIRALPVDERNSQADLARRDIPLDPIAADMVSDTHALLFAWHRKDPVLSDAMFQRLIVIVAFLDAYENRLVSEALATHEQNGTAYTAPLLAALARRPYDLPHTATVGNGHAFSLQAVVDDARAIEDLLSDGIGG